MVAANDSLPKQGKMVKNARSDTKSKPYLLYGSEVIMLNKSELSSLSYVFNSAMCKVYKIDFHSLSTVYYYTGQSEIVDDVVKSWKTSFTQMWFS